MLPVHCYDERRLRRRAALRALSAEERRRQSLHARKRVVVIAAIATLVIAAASLRAHKVLAAHVPNDMPANSRWILTGRDRVSNDKLGLWIGCWKSTIKEVDHCRITNEKGTMEFDGDMLPLAANQDAVPDKDLKLAPKLNAGKIWVRGVYYDQPIPVLELADQTQLVPVSDREGLQLRLARGEWADGLEPAWPSIAEQ